MNLRGSMSEKQRLMASGGSLPSYADRSSTLQRGEEGQPHQSLVRTTFSSFSRPKHIEILVLNIINLSVRSLKINTFFKNIATACIIKDATYIHSLQPSLNPLKSLILYGNSCR